MTYRRIKDQITYFNTNVEDNTTNQVTPADVRSSLTSLAESSLNIRCFNATDVTGATDITSELVSFLNTAAGDPVFIPAGTYLLNSGAVAQSLTTSIEMYLSSKAIMRHNYALDNRAIWIRNESDATLAANINSLDEVVWFHGEKVTRLSLTSVTGYAKGDVVHIHAQDGWLEGQTDLRHIGQSAKIAQVDPINNYIYLYQRLELEPLLVTSPRIRKYTNRRILIDGGIWEANGQYDDQLLDRQNWRRACIDIYATPYVTIRNATFRKTWAQAIILRSCPYFVVENCKFEKLPNLMTGGAFSNGEPYVKTGCTYSSGGTVVTTMSNTTSLVVGMEVIGTGIQSGTYITIVNSSTSVTLSQATTAAGVAASLSFKTNFAITGITKANPCVVTVTNLTAGSSSITLSNGDDILISGVGGMTQLNGRIFRVANLSGTTFNLQEYYGDGDVLSNVNSSSYGTYTTGGFVQEADVNGLGYGVQVYAASCYGVVQNCVFEECRHCVTSDAISGNTYGDSQWATYGLPTNVTVRGCHSYNSHGIPFDLHEEGINWMFADCHVINASRGPDYQDSYYGVGFQDRGISTTFFNCTVNGGAWGIRVSPSDAPIATRPNIQGCLFKNLRSKTSDGSYGLRVLQEVSNPPYPVVININNTRFEDMDTGIQADNNSDVKIVATGLNFSRVGELIDVGYGCDFRALDRVTADFRGATVAGTRRVMRLRSTSKRLQNGSRSSGDKVVTGLDSTAAYSITADTANVSTGSDWVTYTAHGFNTGTQVSVAVSSGGTLPTGLPAGTYYLYAPNADTLVFYDTYANAMAAGATGKVDITATGSGNFTISSAVILAGMYVTGTGIPVGCRVASVDSATQVTLTHFPTTTETSDLTFFPSSTGLFLGGLTIVGEVGNMPPEVFYQSDSNANKYYYMPTNGLVQDTGGTTAATLLMSGATVLVAYNDVSVS